MSLRSLCALLAPPDATQTEDSVGVLLSIFPASALTSRESAWLTRACLERFLDACGQDAGRALTRLLKVLHWRSARGVWGILRAGRRRASAIRRAGLHGPLFVLPQLGQRGHPVVVYHPARPVLGGPDAALDLVVYTMERACAAAPGRQVTLIVDCAGLTIENKPPPAVVCTAVTTLLRMYPAMLDRALVFNASFAIRCAFRMWFALTPTLTRNKLLFAREGGGPADVSADQLDWRAVPLPYRGRSLYAFNAKEYFLANVSEPLSKSEFPFRLHELPGGPTSRESDFEDADDDPVSNEELDGEGELKTKSEPKVEGDSNEKMGQTKLKESERGSNFVFFPTPERIAALDSRPHDGLVPKYALVQK